MAVITLAVAGTIVALSLAAEGQPMPGAAAATATTDPREPSPTPIADPTPAASPSPAVSATPAATPTPTASPDSTAPDEAAGATREVRVWFTSGEQFRSETREIATEGSVVRGTVEALLDGPGDAEQDDNVDSQIPRGVTLRSYEVDDEMVAQVELSPGFLKGIPVAPADRDEEQVAELRARLGQVTYTVTQFGHIKRARISAGDRVLAAFDRDDYDRPAGEPDRAEVDPGPAVAGTREAQQSLANRGYLPKEAVDGKAGDRTKQAVMAFQAWEGLTRDGVIGPRTSAALKTSSGPKPRGDGRRIEVYRAKGVALAVRDGRLVRAIHVSTGKPGFETPAGSYKVFRKERKSWSVPFSAWLPYASYFNRGIAFHEWPAVPAYPASHGCVRTGAAEAAWLYRFADVNTTVDVI